MKATHSAAPKSKGTVFEQTPAEVQGKPIQAADVEGKATLIK
jgi:hypothetical protein